MNRPGVASVPQDVQCGSICYLHFDRILNFRYLKYTNSSIINRPGVAAVPQGFKVVYKCNSGFNGSKVVSVCLFNSTWSIPDVQCGRIIMLFQ